MSIVTQIIEKLRLNTYAKPLWVFGALLLLIVLVGAVPLDNESQYWVVYIALGLMFLLNELKPSQFIKLLMYALAAFIMLRYFFWRTFFTLGSDSFFGLFFCVLLYLAEGYCIVLTFLGMFINIFHVRRDGMAPSGEPESWPSVDVLIPSYNESTDILRDTIIAATQMRYAKGKVNVYLCDDGGTEQKRNDSRPEIAQAAWARHNELKLLCAELGVQYFSRTENSHAKAGNINAALKKSSGELLAIFDADHMPTADFLERTVGYFQDDGKVFLVQTPHFFINADPVERNLNLFGKIPGEGDMFYSQIQPGLDFWNSAFFCGSAAVIRREHLASVGGMKGESITEDAEAALHMHTRGLRSIFVGRPMISGLQPETYSSFVIQRLRWAQGMVQIFLLNKLLTNPGLTLPQKLTYFSTTFFWFFSFVRCVFIISPAMYLIFGLHVYTATVTQVLAYTVPQFIVSFLIMDYIYGRVRTPFISEIYEILQSIYAFVAVSKVIANPHSPTFRVTPKSEDLNSSYISSLAGPFYLVYALSVISLMFGIWRYFAYSAPADRSVTLMICGWELFNLIILNTALGVLSEKKKIRKNDRISSDISAMMHLSDGVVIPCRLTDVTMGGAMAQFEEPVGNLHIGTRCQIILNNPALRKETCFQAELKHILHARHSAKIGLSFKADGLENYKELVALNFGDSDRWNWALHARQQHRTGIWRGLFMLLRLGFKNMLADYPHFLKDSWFMFRALMEEIWFKYFAQRCRTWGYLMRDWMLGK